MEKRITIRDIAKQANVHFTTVSMALRNHPRLPQETCKRLQALAAQMGYRPDPALSALNYYRHSRNTPNHQATLGWIDNTLQEADRTATPSRQATAHTIIATATRPDGFQRGLKELIGHYLKSATDYAESLGFKIDPIYPRAPGMNPERVRKILHSRNISGLLIAPQPTGVTSMELKWEEFSAVKIGHSLKSPELHTIVSHQFHSLRIMLHHLRALGYRRIGVCIENALDLRADKNWQAAFWVDYHSLPVADRVEPFFFSLQDATKSKNFKSWFHSQKPEVIGLLGTAFISEVFSLGRKIPDTLGLALCGVSMPALNIAATKALPAFAAAPKAVTISGVYEDTAGVGRMAIDLLTSMLTRREYGIPRHPHHLLTEGIWVEGNTVRPQSPSR